MFCQDISGRSPDRQNLVLMPKRNVSSVICLFRILPVVLQNVKILWYYWNVLKVQKIHYFRVWKTSSAQTEFLSKGGWGVAVTWGCLVFWPLSRLLTAFGLEGVRFPFFKTFRPSLCQSGDVPVSSRTKKNPWNASLWTRSECYPENVLLYE